MSFSINFDAKTAGDARDLIAKAHAPDCVKEFLVDAVDNLGDQRLTDGVRVKANGHLCDGPASYEVSTAQIEVTPIRFAR